MGLSGMVRKVVLHTGVSLDGFVARLDGSLDWLNSVYSAADTSVYADFLRSCDTTVMGRKTFEQVREFCVKDGVAFPYVGMKNYVFTQKAGGCDETAGLPVTVVNDEDVVEAVKKMLTKPSDLDIHLIGGGQLNGALLAAGLIHKIVLSIVPTVIGTGIRLFEGLPSPLFTRHFQNLATTTYTDSGMVQMTLVPIEGEVKKN